MSDVHKCEGQRWDGLRFCHRPCVNRGVLNENGKWWCRIHAPSRVEIRRQRELAKWNRRAKVRDRLNLISDARDIVLNAAEVWFQTMNEKNVASLVSAIRAWRAARDVK